MTINNLQLKNQKIDNWKLKNQNRMHKQITSLWAMDLIVQQSCVLLPNHNKAHARKNKDWNSNNCEKFESNFSFQKKYWQTDTHCSNNTIQQQHPIGIHITIQYPCNKVITIKPIQTMKQNKSKHNQCYSATNSLQFVSTHRNF